MQRIRLPVAMLISWLFFFYNIERLSKHVNITTAAYILVPAVVVIIVLIPYLIKVHLSVLLLVPIVIFLLLETWMGGDKVWGAALPVTLMEISTIAVTAILARWVSIGVNEFEGAVKNITIGHGGERRTRQGEIYREVQRARAFQRPLTLVAVKADEASIKVALDRMVQEVQQAMIQQYVLARVSKTLIDELDDYNIVAKRQDHFLILFPEATPEKLSEVLERLRKAVQEQVGVTLHIGLASLPDDAATLEALVERAVADMQAHATSASPQRVLLKLTLDNLSLQESPHGSGGHQSA
jgi:GGDEF domain-containing protein